MSKAQVKTILYDNILVNVFSCNKHSSLQIICQPFGELFKNLSLLQEGSFL